MGFLKLKSYATFLNTKVITFLAYLLSSYLHCEVASRLHVKMELVVLKESEMGLMTVTVRMVSLEQTAKDFKVHVSSTSL